MNKIFSKKKNIPQKQPGLILDTCALIDGRIIDIAKAGFVQTHVVIPEFILAELQYLADQGDSQKRERARFGLDVVRELQEMNRITVTIAREQFKNVREVDNKLIALAEQTGGMLYTTDFNLNKVAQIKGVKVLNVNELAQALRPPRLPGEQVEIKITQVGQDKTQGVGYLEDGTMVVVEKAGQRIGQRVTVEFSRMLQTQAGKMMFAILRESNKPKEFQPKKEKFQTHTHSDKQHHQKPSRPHTQARHFSPRRSRPESPEDRLVKLANQ
jgi:uncharacterized protein YacL